VDDSVPGTAFLARETVYAEHCGKLQDSAPSSPAILDFLRDGETEGAHTSCQRCGCPHLFAGQFWMLMQLPSQRDQAWFERLDVLAETDERRHDFLS
jgi:hypothetical protein